MLLKDIVNSVRKALEHSDDLRRPDYKGNPNFYAGHCYVASEAIYHLAKKEGITLKPMFVYHEHTPHWYLSDSGEVLDPTKEQFSTSVDYSAGKGKGFLTKRPSKRATTLIKRALYTDYCRDVRGI